MAADSLDHVFKILLIGDAGVGKSRYLYCKCIWSYFFITEPFFPFSILLQFTDGYFNDNLQSTIGSIILLTSCKRILRSFDRFLLSGVDFKVKVMDAAGPDGRPKKVKVTIWDTGSSFFTIESLSF